MTDPIAPRDAFPPVSLDEWRKKAGDLDGALYTEADLPADIHPVREARGWQIWARADTVEQARTELEGGADGIWYSGRAAELSALDLTEKTVILDEDPLHAVESRELYAPGSSATRSIVISSIPDHEQGADAETELARLFTSALLWSMVDDDAGRAEFGVTAYMRIAVGLDLFEEIAKIRAARIYWMELTGTEAFIHAVCSDRTLTRVDPWTNMMRVTTQAFAAAVGGANAITTNAYDAAGAEPGDLGRRVARNTQLILREEAGLAAYGDAAFGSYYVEARTRELLESARNRRLERDEIEWSDEAIRTRKQLITGVSAFPSSEPPLPRQDDAPRRDADPFELLRDRAAAFPGTPTVQIRKLGTPREHGAAAAFARDLFLAGGFEIVEAEAPIVCACGPGAEQFDGAIVAESLMGREFDAVEFLCARLDEVGA